jgi:hypothetical protein
MGRNMVAGIKDKLADKETGR